MPRKSDVRLPGGTHAEPAALCNKDFDSHDWDEEGCCRGCGMHYGEVNWNDLEDTY